MTYISRPNFQRQHEKKKQDSFTIYLNKEEREILSRCQKIIEQEKDSTALKQLAWIGANLLESPKIAVLLGIIYSNKRKNKRLGIVEFE